MKKLFKAVIIAMLATAATACSKENQNDVVPTPAANVEFITSLPASVATRGPVAISPEEFKILAFRKNSDNTYSYLTEIPVNSMKYEGNTLTGGVQLATGEYKFLPSYGLVTPGSYSWPTLSGATLDNSLYITHNEESFPAAFMVNTPLDAVQSYTVTLDGPKQNVSSNLQRTVSRVDILFLRADKDPATNKYTEKPGSDVFGPEGLASVKIDYTDANNFLGLSGEKADGVFNVSHNLNPAMDAVTMGTGTATAVDTAGYDYENVQPNDIISGSAYVKGTYLIPNADNTATTGMTMTLTSGKGSIRTIPLGNKIPVERNKVTHIKIYVLGENVFTTELGLGVDIDTAWDGFNYTEGEIN